MPARLVENNKDMLSLMLFGKLLQEEAHHNRVDLGQEECELVPALRRGARVGIEILVALNDADARGGSPESPSARVGGLQSEPALVHEINADRFSFRVSESFAKFF